MRFENREDAGQQLSSLLLEKNIFPDCIVAIPRGGVPVALVIAKQLHLPVKLIFIRKLGHPINHEFAIGATTANNILVHNDVFIKDHHPELTALIDKERNRIVEMRKKFAHEIDFASIRQKHILLVDDGIATGTCIELAVQELRKNGAKKITIATPVCPFNSYQHLKKIADEMICCIVAQQFTGISSFYHHFDQLTDDEVTLYLEQLDGHHKVQ
ncbi:MAG: hypothetical protein RL642_487 [Bacteroidota bacterium]